MMCLSLSIWRKYYSTLSSSFTGTLFTQIRIKLDHTAQTTHILPTPEPFASTTIVDRDVHPGLPHLSMWMQNQGRIQTMRSAVQRTMDLQCDVTNTEEVSSRNYCSKHMPKESKATTEYRGRVARN